MYETTVDVAQNVPGHAWKWGANACEVVIFRCFTQRCAREGHEEMLHFFHLNRLAAGKRGLVDVATSSLVPKRRKAGRACFRAIAEKPIIRSADPES
jgi:hypothetical protein